MVQFYVYLERNSRNKYLIVDGSVPNILILLYKYLKIYLVNLWEKWGETFPFWMILLFYRMGAKIMLLILNVIILGSWLNDQVMSLVPERKILGS